MTKKAQVYLISLRGKTPLWAKLAGEEYIKRLAGNLEEITITPPSRNLGKDIEDLLKIEADLLNKTILNIQAKNIVLFDEKGEQFNSHQFAEKINNLITHGKTALIIGGADGFAINFKQNKILFSLGKITLPHELARITALEQIYRAYTINTGHPYHRN